MRCGEGPCAGRGLGVSHRGAQAAPHTLVVHRCRMGTSSVARLAPGAARDQRQQGRPWEGPSHRLPGGLPSRGGPAAFPRPPTQGPGLSGLSFPLLNGQPLPSWPHTAPSVAPLSPVPQGHSPRLCRLTKWASKASGESVNPGHPQPGPAQATAGTILFHPRTEPLTGPRAQPREWPRDREAHSRLPTSPHDWGRKAPGGWSRMPHRTAGTTLCRAHGPG